MIEKLLDPVRKLFEGDGKLKSFYPAYEAIDTFMLTPGKTTSGAPHVRSAIDLKRHMIMVVLAIAPCAVFGIWNTGHQSLSAAGMDAGIVSSFIQGLAYFLPLYFVTLAVGGTIEMVFAVVRKHEITEGFLVTSFLYPLILPPNLPLFDAAVGIAFGVLIGKEVFGGVGMNIFNPALTARAFLFFSHAGDMSGNSVWIAPVLKNVSGYFGNPEGLVDVTAGATSLAQAASMEGAPAANGFCEQFSFLDMFFGFQAGSIGETSALLALVGAIMLIIFGIGSYKTIIGSVVGALVISTLFYFLAPEDASTLAHLPPHYHLVMGGFAFGIAFMATDPVSSPATGSGKWIYGFLIGALVILIRVANPAYPEGTMLAILFMNLFAPLIDVCIVELRIRKRRAQCLAM